MGLVLVRVDPKKVEGRIVDVIDYSDTDLVLHEGKDLLKNTGDGFYYSDRPIPVDKQADPIGFVSKKVAEAAASLGKISLLRFHGHGLPGYQSVCMGFDLTVAEGDSPAKKTEAAKYDAFLNSYQSPQDRRGISRWNYPHIATRLKNLAACFAKDGQVWLMGCDVADEPDGPELVKLLAGLWGVPVSAGKDTQYGGDAATFYIEGGIVTGRP